jgi:hypothetical protein
MDDELMHETLDSEESPVADSMSATPKAPKRKTWEQKMAELKEFLQNRAGSQQISPWQNMLMEALNKSYGSSSNDSPIAQRYDKYYAPFITGALNATKQDVLRPRFKPINPMDSDDEMEHKELYNSDLKNKSMFDAPLTAGAEGLGAMLAAGGGLGSLGLGYGVAKGIPLIANLVKQHYANKNADKKMAERRYQRLLNSSALGK